MRSRGFLIVVAATALALLFDCMSAFARGGRGGWRWTRRRRWQLLATFWQLLATLGRLFPPFRWRKCLATIRRQRVTTIRGASLTSVAISL
jgi:hypothetical protein